MVKLLCKWVEMLFDGLILVLKGCKFDVINLVMNVIE